MFFPQVRYKQTKSDRSFLEGIEYIKAVGDGGYPPFGV